VIGPGERGLDVADEGVDGLELLVEHAGLAALVNGRSDRHAR
jgi:hypothetical protein